MSSCSIDGCVRPVNARGMCSTHYMQQRRAGLLPVGTRARGAAEDRFWRYVEKSAGCWPWTGSKTPKGYGKLGEGGKGGRGLLAHRFSYEVHKGQIPHGLVVMHSCDNPSCVNPDHLTTGTQSENILDSFRKGRKICCPPHYSGQAHYAAKLTDDLVKWIRSSGLSIRMMAAQLGLPESTIGRAKRGQTWRHVK